MLKLVKKNDVAISLLTINNCIKYEGFLEVMVESKQDTDLKSAAKKGLVSWLHY